MGEETQTGSATGTENAAEAASIQVGPLTPELAATLPLAEVKRRMYAEAEESPAPASAGADTPEEDTAEGAVNPDEAGTARDDKGRFTSQQDTRQGEQQSTEDTSRTQPPRQKKQYQSLDEAVRDLDAFRGNLSQAAERERSLQRRVQELEAESTRTRQQAEVAQAEAQHRQFLSLVQQLPTQQARDQAYAEYQQVLARQAMGEYTQQLTTKEQTLQQREFQLAKRDVPAMYEDIARYVAGANNVPEEDMLDIVRDKRILNLIDAAQTPDAIQAVSITLGEILDLEASRLATRSADTKAARREAKAATRVPDVPAGVTPNGGQESAEARIKKMTPAEFTAYKRQLFDAQP